MYLRKNIIHYTHNKGNLPPRCIAVRYYLNWRSHWCKEDDFDEQGRWLGLPQKEYQEIKLNFGTCNHNLMKANSNILPANTRLPRHANVWNMICSALHPIPTLRIPCTDCTSSSRDLVVTSSISLVAGTILSMRRSTAIWLPVRCRCRAIIARGSANIESIAVWY